MMCPMFKQQQSSKQVRLTFKTGSHKIIIYNACGELSHLMQPPKIHIWAVTELQFFEIAIP